VTETERCPVQENFQQGDLLRIVGEENTSVNHGMGVIINADCDLAHSKHDGVIAYLPLFTLQEYLKLFWLPQFFQSERNVAWNGLCTLCDDEHSEWQEVEEWLHTESVEDIALALAKSKKLSNKQLEAIRQHLCRIKICSCGEKEGFSSLNEISELEKRPKSYLEKKVNNALKQMGDGHFLINEIYGELDIGFVIRMRRIHSIDAQCCFKSMSEFRSSSSDDRNCAYRIARLIPPFRYRVAQLFAHQFSRIGLPDEVTALNSLAVDDVVETIRVMGQ